MAQNLQKRKRPENVVSQKQKKPRKEVQKNDDYCVKKMEKTLLDLTEGILLKISDYCSENDKISLAMSCKMYCDVICRKHQEQKVFLMDLPMEIHCNIFKRCNFIDLMSLKLVNSNFYGIVDAINPKPTDEKEWPILDRLWNAAGDITEEILSEMEGFNVRLDIFNVELTEQSVVLSKLVFIWNESCANRGLIRCIECFSPKLVIIKIIRNKVYCNEVTLTLDFKLKTATLYTDFFKIMDTANISRFLMFYNHFYEVLDILKLFDECLTENLIERYNFYNDPVIELNHFYC